MFKLDRKALICLAAATGAIFAGAAWVFAGPMLKTWRDGAALTRAHLTYVQYPCTKKDPDVPCPAYQLDLYGDGTAIYRSLGGTRISGNYRYYVDPAPVRDYVHDFAASAFWDKPVPPGPNRYGGGCLIVMQFDGLRRQNGCLKWPPGTDQAMDDPSVVESIKSLEALSGVTSLSLGDGATTSLLARATSLPTDKY